MIDFLKHVFVVFSLLQFGSCQPIVTAITSTDCLGGTSPQLTGCRCSPSLSVTGTFNTVNPVVVFTPGAGATGTTPVCFAINVLATSFQCMIAGAAPPPTGTWTMTVSETVMGVVQSAVLRPTITFDRPTVTGVSTVACKTDRTGCLPNVGTDVLIITGTNFDTACAGAPLITFQGGVVLPTCVPFQVTSNEVRCALTGPRNAGTATYLIQVDNGIGTSITTNTASLTYEIPEVVRISTPLCLDQRNNLALSGCSSNNRGLTNPQVMAPGPALAGTVGSMLTVIGDNFNTNAGLLTTISLENAQGTVIPCTVVGVITRTSLTCSLAVPDSPLLEVGGYTVILDNSVGLSNIGGTVPAVVTWSGAALTSLSSPICTTRQPLSISCTALTQTGATLQLSGSSFARGYDSCPVGVGAPTCTVPQVVLQTTFNNGAGSIFYVNPTCTVANSAAVTLQGLSCQLSHQGTPPAGEYRVSVIQNGVTSNVGLINFPVTPVITDVDPCNNAAPCRTGDVLTISGQYFSIIPGDVVSFSNGPQGAAPATCSITSRTDTQIQCSLTVPVGTTGQHNTVVSSALNVASICRDPQLCVVNLVQMTPTITSISSPNCGLTAIGPPTVLNQCTTPGVLTIVGTNFDRTTIGNNAVIFSGGTTTPPSCAILTVSATGDRITCQLTTTTPAVTTELFSVQVDVLGLRTQNPPLAPQISLISGNRNPTLNAPADIFICEDSGTFVETQWLTGISDGNQNTQQLSCVVTPVAVGVGGVGSVTSNLTIQNINQYFSTPPSCIVTGQNNLRNAQLFFTSAPDIYGSFYFTVQITDDGTAGASTSRIPCTPVNCEQSFPSNFAIHVLPVNDPPTFMCSGQQTISLTENSGMFSSGSIVGVVTPGGWNERQQQLSTMLTTTNDALFSSLPQLVFGLNGSTTLQFTVANSICGEAVVTLRINDDNNNQNDWFRSGIALVPYNHNRGTTFVKNGQVINTCTHQPNADACTYVVSVSCDNGAPSFVPGPGPITVMEDSNTFRYVCWAKNISAGGGNEGATQTVFFDVQLVDPFHRSLFQIQPSINGNGDLVFEPAPDAHTLNRRVFASIQARDTSGAVSCDVFVVCPMPTCCPEVEIIITPVNDPPSFLSGGNVQILEDASPSTLVDWATQISVGPENEGVSSVVFEQQVSQFTLTPNSPELFQNPLELAQTCAAVNQQGTVCEGALVIQPLQDAFGYTKVRIVQKDTGPNLARDGTVPDIGLDGSNEALPQWFTIEIIPVNDAPSFGTIPPLVSVLEDSGSYVSLRWLPDVSAGPANEDFQFLSFTVTALEPSLFEEQPTLVMSSSSMAGLRFKPAADETGSSLVTILLTDDGGTANGGVNRVSGSFTIVVEAVNDPPTFTPGNNITVYEDSTVNTFPAWAGNLSPGPGASEAGQVLEFRLSASSLGGGVGQIPLFRTNVEVGTSGTLSFTLNDNAFGSTLVAVQLSDDGVPVQRTTADNSLLITVLPVNDPPTFTAGPDISTEECQGPDPCPFAYANWGTSISPGPTNEADQTLRFEVIVPNTVTGFGNVSLFETFPTIDNVTGTLRFSLNPRINHRSIIPLDIILIDSNGTENGGSDRSSHTLLLLVSPVDSAPSFRVGTPVVIPEDSGQQYHPGWAKNISAGGVDEDPGGGGTVQRLTFSTSSVPSGPSVWIVQPTINELSGDLVYQTARDFNGLIDVLVTLSDGAQSFSQAFIISVTPVNDPPIIVPGPDVITVFENEGLQVRQWTPTPLLPGPPDEIAEGQAARYNIVVETPNLLEISPAVGPLLHNNGTLVFKTRQDYSGDAILWITASDDGDGPGNVTTPNRLIIRILPINSPPTFNLVPQNNILTVWEDYGVVIRYNWVDQISPGPGEEQNSQTVSFEVTATNPSLFEVQPAISPSGDLNFSTALNQFGETDVIVVAVDQNGAQSLSETFRIIVSPANDAPTFTPGPVINLLEDDTSVEFPAWARDISPGPFNELGQTYNFTVALDNPQLFEVFPYVTPASGTLFWRLAPNQNGQSSGTVCLTDNGGVEVPGRDFNTTCRPIMFIVAPVNDNPSILVASTTIEVLEDSGSVTLRAWGRNIVAGPQDEIDRNQLVEQLEFRFLSGSNLFVDNRLPVINVNGDLTFTVAPNVFGTSELILTLRDSAMGVTEQRFSITVLPVNDPPLYSSVFDTIEVSEDSLRTTRQYAVDVLPGPANEIGQSIEFIVEDLHNSSQFFTEPPRITPNGELSFLPLPNAHGTFQFNIRAADNGGEDRGGIQTSTARLLTIVVTPVNDLPSFNSNLWDLQIVEDAGRVRFPGWATNISPGPDNELSQTVRFNSSNYQLWRDGRPVASQTASSIFKEEPWIEVATGDLFFQVQDNVFGEIRVDVQLFDSSNAASVARTLTISVTPVNDPPSFVAPVEIIIPEDNGLTVLPNWITGASAGPFEDEFQSIIYGVTCRDEDLWIFRTQPIVTPGVLSSDLTFEIQPNLHGELFCTLMVTDNSVPVGVSSHQFRILVLSVNDAPCVSKNTNYNIVTVPEDSPEVLIRGWVSNPGCTGAPNEAQVVSYVVAVSDTHAPFFKKVPTVSSAGDLSFEIQSDVSGLLEIPVFARDDGGILHGGVDTSLPLILSIQITPLNDAPVFTAGPAEIIVTTASLRYSAQWATNVRGGPGVDEGPLNDRVSFTVDISNPELFTMTGMPVVSPSGFLDFTAVGIPGTSQVTVTAVDEKGLRTSFLITIRVEGPGRVVFSAATDRSTTEQQFASTVAQVLGTTVSNVQISQKTSQLTKFILSTPELESRFISLASNQQSADRLATDLGIVSISTEQGVVNYNYNPPNIGVPGPAGANANDSELSTGEIIGLAFGILAALFLIGLAVFCYKKKSRKKKRRKQDLENVNTVAAAPHFAEANAMQQRAYFASSPDPDAPVIYPFGVEGGNSILFADPIKTSNPLISENPISQFFPTVSYAIPVAETIAVATPVKSDPPLVVIEAEEHQQRSGTEEIIIDD